MRQAADDAVEPYLARAREDVERALAEAVPSRATPPVILHEAMRYTLLLPAKRLRSVLVVAVAEMLRGRRETAIEVACAIEMVHAASLVLDDLPSQDDATMRRGQPVLHRVLGEANATLAAVALLNHAFASIARLDGVREKVRVRCVSTLAKAVGSDGLIAGQVVDLGSTGKKIGLEELEYIHSHKTGALFIAAAELGGIVAGARERDLSALALYAKNLGLAFQITDDLLDYTGDPQATGKDAGLDRDKTTFVRLSGIDGARRLVDELIDASQAFLSPFGKRAALLKGIAERVRDRDR